MEPPSEEELNIIRAEIDPGGFSTSRGEWITIDGASGQRIRQEKTAGAKE